MSFAEPLGLLGLLALPVIVVLHLLRQRVRREPIPSLRLWAQMEKEVRGSRFRRIPLTWVLLLQLLAALVLTGALARPQLPRAVQVEAARRLLLLVDTSLSMSATDAAPTRLAQAQAQAGALLATLGEVDSAVLISVGPDAVQLADTASVGLPALAAALGGLKPAGLGSDWPGAMALAAGAVAPGQDNRLVILTDGAFAFPEELAARPPAPVEWHWLGGSQPNQAVVALEARTLPSGAVQVFSRLANFGDVTVRRAVTLLGDGAVVDSHVAEIGPSLTTALSWTLPPDVAAVEVRLAAGDVLTADDRAALGVAAGRPIDALLVAAEPGPVERALRALPNVALSVVSPGSYAAFETHDLTVFRGWLPEAWPSGGVLVFEPPAGSPLLPTSGTARAADLGPAPADPLLAEVALDLVTFGDVRVLQPEPWLVPVLSDQDGRGLAWRGATGASRLVVFPFALDDTNVIRRSAFPVLVANAAAEVLPPALPASVAPGTPVALPLAEHFPALTLTRPDGEARTLGADRPAVLTDTFAPGLYQLEAQTATGGTWRTGFGVNAGSALESDLRAIALPEFGDAPETTVTASTRLELEDLWPWVVLAAIVVLLAEASLAWR